MISTVRLFTSKVLNHDLVKVDTEEPGLTLVWNSWDGYYYIGSTKIYILMLRPMFFYLSSHRKLSFSKISSQNYFQFYSRYILNLNVFYNQLNICIFTIFVFFFSCRKLVFIQWTVCLGFYSLQLDIVCAVYIIVRFCPGCASALMFLQWLCYTHYAVAQ